MLFAGCRKIPDIITSFFNPVGGIVAGHGTAIEGIIPPVMCEPRILQSEVPALLRHAAHFCSCREVSRVRRGAEAGLNITRQFGKRGFAATDQVIDPAFGFRIFQIPSIRTECAAGMKRGVNRGRFRRGIPVYAGFLPGTELPLFQMWITLLRDGWRGTPANRNSCCEKESDLGTIS